MPPKKSPKVADNFTGARLAADMTPDARSKSSITLALDGVRFSRVIACMLAIADWIHARMARRYQNHLRRGGHFP